MITSGKHVVTATSIFPLSSVPRNDEMLFFSPPSLLQSLCVIYTLPCHSIFLVAWNYFTANHFLFHLFFFIERHRGMAGKENEPYFITIPSEVYNLIPNNFSQVWFIWKIKLHLTTLYSCWNFRAVVCSICVSYLGMTLAHTDWR